jgi:hypothetical protein
MTQSNLAALAPAYRGSLHGRNKGGLGISSNNDQVLRSPLGGDDVWWDEAGWCY